MIKVTFAPITLFFSFWGFLSKNNAQLNIMTNKKHQEYNFNHKEEIDLYNDHLQKNINRDNEKINIKNNLLYEKYLKVKNEEINLVEVIKDDWINLRQASNFTYDNLENKKGVYIIWNKTKNIYYVGQSKNMKKRLNNHFKNGDVNNIIFAKDWYNDDEFYYKYYFCDTKDELDLLEKKYIELYNSFENGYNKTGGNK
ncbi:excinuclease [Spiroplasma melliferum IPMB4A]|nr:excinuclease [Spiroplasma melliferum IPMB4A]